MVDGFADLSTLSEFLLMHKMGAKDTQINQMTPIIKAGGHFSIFIHVYKIIF